MRVWKVGSTLALGALRRRHFPCYKPMHHNKKKTITFGDYYFKGAEKKHCVHSAAVISLHMPSGGK